MENNMRGQSPIFDDATLLEAGSDAYDLMHEMAVVYEEGSATDFNERQFVFELGHQLRSRLRTRDPESEHPFVAYEYHYPDERGEFRKTECDIVLWERHKRPRLDKSQWIEVKSTGFKYGAYNNDFGGLDKGRRGDFAKLAALNTESWKVSSTGSWVWLYQTTTYAPEFAELAARLGRGSEGWSEKVGLADVSRALGKANDGNVNLPKMLLAAADAEQVDSSTMRFRTDLKTAPEGKGKVRKPLVVFIAVCSVGKLG
jgi:hypothetical protein